MIWLKWSKEKGSVINTHDVGDLTKGLNFLVGRVFLHALGYIDDDELIGDIVLFESDDDTLGAGRDGESVELENHLGRR